MAGSPPNLRYVALFVVDLSVTILGHEYPDVHFWVSDKRQSTSLNDVYIPVMGMTGSGKSTFIESCVAQPGLLVGHGLDSCTFNENQYWTA